MSTSEGSRDRGIVMSDQELAIFGERLYEAVLLTPLPAGTILGLATAIRCNMTWADLPRALRFAIFKIAAACLEEPVAEEAAESPAEEAPAAGPAMAETAPGPSTEVAAQAADPAPGPDGAGSAVADGDDPG